MILGNDRDQFISAVGLGDETVGTGIACDHGELDFRGEDKPLDKPPLACSERELHLRMPLSK